MKSALGCVIFLLSLMLLARVCLGAPGERAVAVGGVLDLSGRDFSGGEILFLRGEWDFYWGRLLSPEQLNRSDPSDKTGTFAIPGYWNGRIVAGRSLSGDGCATFRLRVRLPKGGPPLGLRLEDQATAYRLWANGSEIMANGQVGADAASSVPGYRIETASLPASADPLDLVLQVSNFHLRDGGPHRGIALGSVQAIQRRHLGLLALDLLLFGTLGVIGLYHLLLFFLRRRDLSPLYFGLFCLVWGLATPFGGTGGRFVTLFLPDLPWYWLSRTDLFCWFASVPLGVLFFYSLYPDLFIRWIPGLAVAVSLPFTAFLVVAPSRSLGAALIPYQAFSLGVAIGICLFLVWARRRGRPGAALLLAGFGLFVATVINDILYMNLLIDSVYLISVGAMVFVFSQALVLSRRSAQSFAAVEALTTELEEKNLALSRLDQLKDEFLANTSHELRTPLNGMIGIAESLLGGAAGTLPEAARGNLSLVVSSGRRLAHLINDILDFSRLRHRDIVLRQHSVDLFSLAEEVVAAMRPLAEGKSLTLFNAIPETLTPAMGDEDRLQQILYNLIGNAIKFTEQGEVRIGAEQKGSMVEVAVSDTGIGIAADRHQAIFYSFEQADASDERLFGGAGLGLSITKQLVELHGGTIGVTSTPGAGAVFRFTLPAPSGIGETERAGSPEWIAPPVPLPAVVGAAEPVADLPGFEERATILAVDDDPVNLQVVTNALTFRNVTLLTASGGREAIGRIEQGPRPDLVLLDLMMPRMSGFEVCRWVRGRYSSAELPVILLTARDLPGDVARGFAAGANDYLVKPFFKEELIARVVGQLRLKLSYLTLRENLALRRELEERRQSEQELRLVQRRLSSMLDGVDDALLAVNQSGEITFCNRAGEGLLGHRTEHLLGRPLREVVQMAGAEGHALQDCFAGAEGGAWGTATFVNASGAGCQGRFFLSHLELEEEPVCLMILRQGDSAGAPLSRETSRGLALVAAINRNRVRLQAVQGALHETRVLAGEPSRIFMELAAVDQALDGLSQALLSPESHESKRHLAVEVMACALDYWTECSGLSKVDLARRSGLWKVYTNQDGWERTQTLDRYLQIETFPQRPLWNKILKTAEFALTSGNAPSPLRDRLEILLARLRAER